MKPSIFESDIMDYPVTVVIKIVYSHSKKDRNYYRIDIPEAPMRDNIMFYNGLPAGSKNAIAKIVASDYPYGRKFCLNDNIKLNIQIATIVDQFGALERGISIQADDLEQIYIQSGGFSPMTIFLLTKFKNSLYWTKLLNMPIPI